MKSSKINKKMFYSCGSVVGGGVGCGIGYFIGKTIQNSGGSERAPEIGAAVGGLVGGSVIGGMALFAWNKFNSNQLTSRAKERQELIKGFSQEMQQSLITRPTGNMSMFEFFTNMESAMVQVGYQVKGFVETIRGQVAMDRCRPDGGWQYTIDAINKANRTLSNMMEQFNKQLEELTQYTIRGQIQPKLAEHIAKVIVSWQGELTNMFEYLSNKTQEYRSTPAEDFTKNFCSLLKVVINQLKDLHPLLAKLFNVHFVVSVPRL